MVQLIDTEDFKDDDITVMMTNDEVIKLAANPTKKIIMEKTCFYQALVTCPFCNQASITRYNCSPTVCRAMVSRRKVSGRISNHYLGNLRSRWKFNRPGIKIAKINRYETNMENNSIVPGTNFTIDEAIDWLMFCSDQYYILGSSPVSDADYDYVCAATRAVIPEHPFFAGIRIALNTNKKIQLKNKLYSLRQIKTAQDAKTGACSLSETFLELDDWLTKTRTKLNDDKVVCFAMPKYSGLTVVIYYENGYLISAATSGDGLEGRDVTEHIKRIDGIPFKIPGNLDIEIRGDVIMRNSKFASYTQNEFNDARSVVAGTLNLDDYELVSDRGLDFCPWDVLLNNEEFSLCEKEKFRLLREWKFHNIGEFGEVTSIDDIKNYFIQMDNVRKTIGSDNRPIQEDSMLDGIVVTIANEKMQKKLGYHNACPEFSIVIKFASEVVEATVISIDWQLNRHGVFSPVAVLEPVILEGMLVFKAMLNNYARVERDCIGIGTRVLIRKAGPVLPQIINIIDKISTNNNAPEICPSCKEPVTQQNVNLVCLNSNCKTQLFERLYHFVSIVIPINIGLDRVFVKSLFDANLARSPADLYLITRSALIATYGIGQNKASLFLSAIEGSKKIKLAALLRSLSIPLTGEAWAKKLASLLEYDGSRLLNPIGMTYEGSKKLLYEKKMLYNSD